MKEGDLVKASWEDGLVLVGRYLRQERGYIILEDKEKKQIVCDSNHVKFEVIG